ncbi:MAG TPA: hypothetical protein VK879_04030, partial [Candidatus Sulfomarinibacteraceae bacterium]|nr:hypothetical protein [Candidatus Sulfomarinibacteraceae bacterium]
PLLFHLNQHLDETAKIASRTCYRGLLRVLRAHPTVPVNIHISGTLIDALKWLDPEPLQLIWEGLRAGQFELLGSTYAQNVPYASDDWDNAQQIEQHQKVLHDTFGVTPVTFWNPERTWRQSLLPIIADAGYRFTLIEDHILAKARLAEPVVVTSQVGAHILTVLYDDHLLRHMFNFAVWFGRPSQLQMYLLRRADHPNVAGHCLTYAEDAEAMGFWGWQEGVVPNQTWHRLDQVLSLLEALPEVELIHLTNAPASAGNLSPIPEGAAHWMNWSLGDEDRPYHEPGYEDWFDFNESSPKLAEFRAYFSEIREALQSLSEKVAKKSKKNSAAGALYDAALYNYLAHQYEFGCVGVGGEDYPGWKGANASWVLMQAAEWALQPEQLSEQKDVNRDDEEELILGDGRNVIVASPMGGRLLYWFDLEKGKQYVGNQLAVTPGPYEGDGALPANHTVPYELWLPEDARPQPIVSGARLAAEAKPTRMAKHLPDWIWEGEREPFELLTTDVRQEGERRLLPARRRAFVDYISVDGQEASPGEALQATLEDDVALFRRTLDTRLSLEKQFELRGGDVVVTYRWVNEGDEKRRITWRTLCELTPDYSRQLEEGRKGLQFVEDVHEPAVRNVPAREQISLVADKEARSIEYEEALLALELSMTFDLSLEPGDEETIVVRLRHSEVAKGSLNT